MILIPDRVNEIMSRINDLNTRFNSGAVRKTEENFDTILEKTQEKLYEDQKNDPVKYNGLIREYSMKYDVPENLVKSVIKQESNFDPKAVSPKGAKGLMQLMPETADELGVEDEYDPEQNIEGGVKYLKMMLDKFDGNVVKALAAYNAGPEAVDKNNGVPNYEETKNYIKKILNNMKNY